MVILLGVLCLLLKHKKGKGNLHNYLKYSLNYNHFVGNNCISVKANGHCVKIVQIWSFFWSVFSRDTENHGLFGHFAQWGIL